MATEKSQINEEIIDDDMVSFFDLLAQYDFEDQKRNAVINPSSFASAPGELGLGST